MSEKQSFSVPDTTKNTKGDLGPICNYCGGYGFTNGLKGSSTCPDCHGDGIQPVNVRELYAQVVKITELMGDIITTLQKKRIFITKRSKN